MGCDIHLTLEKRVQRKTTHYKAKWMGLYSTDLMPDSFSLLIRERNYRFFANIANVKNKDNRFKVKEIRQPRGLPDNLSELSKHFLYNNDNCSFSDFHHITYMTLLEFLDVFLKVNKGCLSIHKEISPYYSLAGIEGEPDPEDYRMIIYFDN